MTDAELAHGLTQGLGIMGGSGDSDEISVAYQGASLKIWVQGIAD
jgi:hypothetical protein